MIVRSVPVPLPWMIRTRRQAGLVRRAHVLLDDVRALARLERVQIELVVRLGAVTSSSVIPASSPRRARTG